MFSLKKISLSTKINLRYYVLDFKSFSRSAITIVESESEVISEPRVAPQFNLTRFDLTPNSNSSS